MHAFTEAQIRAGFVNASRREAAQANLPDLDAVEWDRLDVLGWTDAKRPGMSYVVFDGDPDGAGEARCVLLRPTPRPPDRRRMMCSWCQDVTATDDVNMYVARRAGEAGRRGNTIGTSICGDFSCSANVRRHPTPTEVGSASPEERAAWIQARVDSLRERTARFLQQVLIGD